MESLNYPMSRTDYAATLAEIALVQMNQRKFGDVQYLLDTALEIAPENHRYHYRYFTYFAYQNNKAEALLALDKAISLAIDEQSLELINGSTVWLRNYRRITEFTI